MKIKNVVVIGSGTMGSGIAAHLCNANIPVTLLDLKTEISQNARERISSTILFVIFVVFVIFSRIFLSIKKF